MNGASALVRAREERPTDGRAGDVGRTANQKNAPHGGGGGEAVGEGGLQGPYSPRRVLPRPPKEQLLRFPDLRRPLLWSEPFGFVA